MSSILAHDLEWSLLVNNNEACQRYETYTLLSLQCTRLDPIHHSQQLTAHDPVKSWLFPLFFFSLLLCSAHSFTLIVRPFLLLLPHFSIHKPLSLFCTTALPQHRTAALLHLSHNMKFTQLVFLALTLLAILLSSRSSTVDAADCLVTKGFVTIRKKDCAPLPSQQRKAKETMEKYRKAFDNIPFLKSLRDIALKKDQKPQFRPPSKLL
ncbi:hypothetical protein GQ42DRAFT_55890 [Ramicandelaber brevisporus]|nr:hypothetical protein GQ42DRAFT_55890 [Ramicandelaber brevisporus]